MSSHNNKKREAQSPLSGDDEDLKRRIIGENAPVLVSLEDINEGDESTEAESELTNILRMEGEKGPYPDSSMSQKVESLIGRMDRFMQCFASLQASTSKNQRSNDKKFKLLESAHNTLATKVSESAALNDDRMVSLEKQLKDATSANAALTKKVDFLIEERVKQSQTNEMNSKAIKSLGIEQGFIIKNVNDCHAEVKERKMIVSGVPESPGENVATVALGCINKVIQAAIALKDPNAHREGLRKLGQDSIDNVFRIGKPGKYRKRNISITFMRVDIKEMVFRAKAEVKDDEGIKFFLNDDTTLDGRTLKSKLKRIVTTANTLGRVAKLAGNKVIIDGRSYSSNELGLVPKDVTASLKQEKEIDDGIVYRGEYSTFSNFFPAPFSLDGISYAHVEQHYQSIKALHHNVPETADRIMNMSNPLRIKSLGDSIESDDAWIKRRMLVLYDGVRAKFEQNLVLQDELLSTEGKHLYEATTDIYFGCGIGFDSKRWQNKDWSGENVAGLIVRKVRDELLGIQPDDLEGQNTLTEIASQDNINSSSEMEVNTSGAKCTGALPDDSPPATDTDRMSRGPRDHEQSVGTQSDVSAPRSQVYTQRGRNRGRGRGRGRGKGSRGRGSNKSSNMMSEADRNFLGIKEKNITSHNVGQRSWNNQPTQASTPKPKQMNWSHLTESQKKGLAKLGLTPDLLPTDGSLGNVQSGKV